MRENVYQIGLLNVPESGNCSSLNLCNSANVVKKNTIPSRVLMIYSLFSKCQLQIISLDRIILRFGNYFTGCSLFNCFGKMDNLNIFCQNLFLLSSC